MISFTSHAARRYVERVKPAFTVDQAKQELERLLPGCEIRDEFPGWAHRTSTENVAADAVAVCGDGICFPVVRSKGGWLAITCLTRGGSDDAHRAAKNRRRADRRRARAMRRRKQLERKVAKQARAADGLR